jgi:predicted SnoaL-like aldol condensation-catalyzing enzyme
MKTNMTSALGAVFMSLALGTNATAAPMKVTKEAKMNEQKHMVIELLKSIETGATDPVSYINPKKYIQHNLGAEDGLEGFGKLLSLIPKGSAKVNTIRVFSDGDYVFAHTDYNFFGPKVGFDIFRFENGKIVEHWDNLTEKTPLNPSGRSQIDGESQLKDLKKTKANKKRVEDFVRTVLIKQQYDQASLYIAADQYKQHNSQIGDNLSGLQTALGALEKQGVKMVYSKIHRVLGEGNFVLVVSEGMFGGKATAYYDLFRVDGDKIVEHWDVIETIPPKDLWKNQNGKF